MTRGHDALEPVDVVEVVDHDQADAVLDRQLEFLVGLGVAVQDEPGRIGARLERGQDLAAARDVEVQALFDHHPLNGRARERLRRERHIAARPSAAERGEVVAGALTQGVLGRRRWPGCRTAAATSSRRHPPTVRVPSLSRPVPGGKRPSNSSVVASVWTVIRLSVPPLRRA